MLDVFRRFASSFLASQGPRGGLVEVLAPRVVTGKGGWHKEVDRSFHDASSLMG